VVLDLESVTLIDTDGGDELRATKDDLDRLGVGLAVSRLNNAGRTALRADGVFERLGAAAFHPTVEAAVAVLEAEQPEP
jgi:anti-anti-sigma regulatory factor